MSLGVLNFSLVSWEGTLSLSYQIVQIEEERGGVDLESCQQSEVKNRIRIFITSDKKKYGGFPSGTVVKNPPASAGDTGSSPGPGRSHMLRSN